MAWMVPWHTQSTAAPCTSWDTPSSLSNSSLPTVAGSHDSWRCVRMQAAPCLCTPVFVSAYCTHNRNQQQNCGPLSGLGSLSEAGNSCCCHRHAAARLCPCSEGSFEEGVPPGSCAFLERVTAARAAARRGSGFPRCASGRRSAVLRGLPAPNLWAQRRADKPMATCRYRTGCTLSDELLVPCALGQPHPLRCTSGSASVCATKLLMWPG